jgi:uncharacterized protein (TIGR02145 family)
MRTKISTPSKIFLMLAFMVVLAGCKKDDEPVFGKVTDIDGNEYVTVKIGDQRWMAENLKTTRYRDGSNIEFPGEDIAAWQNNKTGAYSWYNNDPTQADTYGPLYNWYAVNNSKGVCPAGWRVSTTRDWQKVVNHLMAKFNVKADSEEGNAVGDFMKSCRMVNSPLGGECATSVPPRWDNHSVYHGTDDVSFSAFPGGDRLDDGRYRSQGMYGFWWTKSDADQEFFGRYYYINFDRDRVFNALKHKNYGLSVRCVRD